MELISIRHKANNKPMWTAINVPAVPFQLQTKIAAGYANFKIHTYKYSPQLSPNMEEWERCFSNKIAIRFWRINANVYMLPLDLCIPAF